MSEPFSNYEGYEGMRALVDQLTAERDLFRDAGGAAERRIVELRAELTTLEAAHDRVLFSRDAIAADNATLQGVLDHEREKTATLRAELAAAETELDKPLMRELKALRELREAAEAMRLLIDREMHAHEAYGYAHIRESEPEIDALKAALKRFRRQP